MSGLIKQVLIVLVRFTRSFATKCIFLNNETCMAGATLMDSNPDELGQGLCY